jgi:hypothetical protein
VKHLKLFKDTLNEKVEIRSDSLKDEQFEDWNYIMDIFVDLLADWNIIKSSVSQQERYHLNLYQKNLETFSLSYSGKTISGSFEPFKLKDIEYELLTFINYLGDRFVCIKINHMNYKKTTAETIKLTDLDLQKGIDFLDKSFTNIYYLHFYYKSDIY